MYTPVSLSIVDFMSHEETLVDFPKSVSTMIYGLNKDDGDDGADSNGSGKSAIVKAITIALVDVPDNSLNKDDYIRDECKAAVLRLRLENKLTGATLEIERTIKKSGASLLIWENGELNSQITSVKEGNQRILDLLGISKDDILNYFIINQDNSHSFFEATDSDQKRIVSRFTNSNLVDTAISEIDNDLKNTESLLDQFDDTISASESKKETLGEAIIYEKEQRSEDFNKTKEKINSEISQKIQENNKLKVRLAEKQKEQAELKNRLVKLGEESDFDTSKEKETFKSLGAQLKEASNEAKEAKKLSDELELKLSGIIECPKCNHKWLAADPETNLDLLQKSLDELSEFIEENKALQKQIEEQEEELEAKILKKNSKKEKHADLLEEVRSSQIELKRIIEKGGNLKEDIASLKEKIAKLAEFSLNSERIAQLGAQLANEEEIIAQTKEKQAVSLLEKEELIFWKINFGMKGFKTYLVNKVLSSLEGYVNFHLKQFKTNLQVKVNGYKKLKSGDISEKIDILVARDGENWKKYLRHSGGQRRRINVCGILTIHKLINMSSKSGGLDLLILDEFFEGLDSSGQGEILHILNQSKITNLVISHNNNDIGAASKITVEYRGGVSRIIK